MPSDVDELRASHVSPLVEMMLERAAKEIKEGKLEDALEHAMAIIALEPTAQAYLRFIEASLVLICRAVQDNRAHRIAERLRNHEALFSAITREDFEEALPNDDRRLLFAVAPRIGKPDARDCFQPEEWLCDRFERMVNRIGVLLHERVPENPPEVSKLALASSKSLELSSREFLANRSSTKQPKRSRKENTHPERELGIQPLSRKSSIWDFTL